MNQQSPYMTTAQLGIQEWERDGLIALVGPLSRGELNYDQGSFVNTGECGTAGCIGGWLAFLSGRDTEQYVEQYMMRGALNDLYWGLAGTGHEPSYTQGAQAVVNFLTTADPQWAKVMSTVNAE